MPGEVTDLTQLRNYDTVFSRYTTRLLILGKEIMMCLKYDWCERRQYWDIGFNIVEGIERLSIPVYVALRINGKR